MMEISEIMKLTEVVFSDGLMVMSMMDKWLEEKWMDLEDILMLMDKFMKEIMLMELKKEKENLLIQMDLFMIVILLEEDQEENANIISGGKTIPVEYTDGRFYQV